MTAESSQSVFNLEYCSDGRQQRRGRRQQHSRRPRRYAQVSFEANSLYDRLEELLEYLYLNYDNDSYAYDTNLLVRRLIDWLTYFSLRREDDEHWTTESRSSRDEELTHSLYYASYVDVDRVLSTLATLSTRDLFECNRNVLCKLRHWIQCVRSKYVDRHHQLSRCRRRGRASTSFDDHRATAATSRNDYVNESSRWKLPSTLSEDRRDRKSVV